MKRTSIIIAVLLLGSLPLGVHAQIIGDSVYSLNNVLDRLFEEMLPSCERLIDVGRAIAGFAALWYIAMRVWKHIARAESIDFFPLLRPFAIGMAIMLYPSVIGLMNGVLKPLETGTRDIAKDSHKAILIHMEEQAKKNRENPPGGIYFDATPETEKYEQPDGSTQEDGTSWSLGGLFSFLSLKNMFQVFLSELLNVLYAAASLCINTIRTFYLIVLAILGPIVFGLSVFDGFQNTLSSWFARYIHVYMWLPVANIFGGICSKVLENMILLDQGFTGTIAYSIFLVIAIIGYTTVPNVAGYIVQAGGKDTLLHKVNAYSQQAAKAAVGAIV